jgi:hypothetical protein
MSRKIVHFLLLTALVAVSSLALADPPTLVGRISAAEGRVTVHTDDGDETGSLLNWPVKAGDRIATATNGRTEFRVGPVAVRLDGDSALDIEELDEDVMHLRLNYGSASVRVRDPLALSGFQLVTPQSRVTLTEAGMVRIDTERDADTTSVSVLLGTARVEAGGTVLNLRTGKRADIHRDDIDTGLARQDGFDSWALSRDRRDDAAIATRYIPSDVTGYEELDHYGSWTVNDEYGPLWAPRSLASDWAPYRDGRWAWVAPWGWTWVDNAPWGYAPFHYGRWVVVNRRWCWSPGRIVGRPVWAPALVGWVGGDGWSVSFSDRRRGPGMGWYPLTPRDRYVPHYQISSDHERRLGWSFRGNERWKTVPVRREGVTIVPRDQFEQRRSVRVSNLPRGTVAANPAALPSGAPVVPGFVRDRNRDGIVDRVQVDRNRDGVADRLQTDRNRDGTPDRLQTDRNRDGTPDRLQTDRNRDGVVDRAQADRVQTDRNRDGTPDRLQTDRNRFGIADRVQTEQNNDRDRIQMRERSQVVVTERPHVDRPQVVERPRFSAPATPQPQPQAQQQMQQPQPQPAARPQVERHEPARPIVASERMERQREVMEDRAERRREMESRRETAQAAPRPTVQAAPTPAPAPQAPAAQPRQERQERQAPAQAQGGPAQTKRGERGENSRER